MCDPIVGTLIKMQPHNSQPSRENATPSSGTYPLAYSTTRKTPPPPRVLGMRAQCGMPKVIIRITGLHENLGRND